MKRISLLFIMLFFLFSGLVSGQKKHTHNLQFTIIGIQDSAAILIYYYGGQQYLKDTFPFIKEKLVIKGDSLLRTGMYALININHQHIMDFFVGENEQHFSFVTTRRNIARDIKIKNSLSNTKFYEWVRFVDENQVIRDSLRNLWTVDADKKNDIQSEALKQQLDELDKKVASKQKELFDSTPKLLVSRFMKAQQEIDIPAIKPDGTEADNLFKFRFNKEHYFDNLLLYDEPLLYTPIYDSKVSYFLNYMTVPHPDSLIYDTEILLEKAKLNYNTYKYIVWKAANYSEISETMGMDKAFVYLVDNYYANDEDLILPAIRTRMMKRADELRGSLIGNIAPNMIMQDSALHLRDLSKITADFVLLYFFDPDCGHCKTATDSLIALYKNKEMLNLEIFAVCSDPSMDKMKKYINEKEVPWIVVNGPRSITKPYDTLYDVSVIPTMYLIDRNKTIIGKRLATHQMVELMKKYAMENY